MSPMITYGASDIPQIMQTMTPHGETVGRLLGTPDLLRDLLNISSPSYAADYNNTGKVSYSEAILYRMMQHRANITSTTFPTKDGKYTHL